MAFIRTPLTDVTALPNPPSGQFTITLLNATTLQTRDSAGVINIIGGGGESDPIFNAWLTSPPNVSIFTNDAGYITGSPWEVGLGTDSAQLIGSTSATGNYSVAEGQATLASGTYSHAEGNNTIASGINSHAQNDLTIASGINSTSIGSGSSAVGDNSLATGYLTLVDGNNSASFGTNSHSIRPNEIVLGTTEFASIGDAQNSKVVVSGTATPPQNVTLSVQLSINKSYNITCKLIGRTTNISSPNEQSLVVNFEGLIQLGPNFSTVTLVYNQTGYWGVGDTWNGVTSVYGEGNPTPIYLNPNILQGTLDLVIAGETGKRIRWVATFELTEVGSIATY